MKKRTLKKKEKKKKYDRRLSVVLSIIAILIIIFFIFINIKNKYPKTEQELEVDISSISEQSLKNLNYQKSFLEKSWDRIRGIFINERERSGELEGELASLGGRSDAKKCEECGNGGFICNKVECEKLESNCYYNPMSSPWGNDHCRNLNEMCSFISECEDYSYIKCEDDPCNLGCELIDLAGCVKKDQEIIPDCSVNNCSGLTGRGVKVGIISTGLDKEHPDFDSSCETIIPYEFKSDLNNYKFNGEYSTVTGSKFKYYVWELEYNDLEALHFKYAKNSNIGWARFTPPVNSIVLTDDSANFSEILRIYSGRGITGSNYYDKYKIVDIDSEDFWVSRIQFNMTQDGNLKENWHGNKVYIWATSFYATNNRNLEFDNSMLPSFYINKISVKTNLPCADTRIIQGYNFVNNNNDLTDTGAFGTAVAGIISGNSHLNGMFNGIAKGSDLYVYKAYDLDQITRAIERSTDPNQDGDTSDHLDILYLAYNCNSDVCLDQNSQINKAIENAYNKGVLIIFPAGENIWKSIPPNFIGISDKVISVGDTFKENSISALDALSQLIKKDEVLSNSASGPLIWKDNQGLLNFYHEPDIVAPGYIICYPLSTDISILKEQTDYGYCNDAVFKTDVNPSGNYKRKRYSSEGYGTIYAGAIVTGAAALVKQAHPDWTNQDIKNFLLGNTRNNIHNSLFQEGKGILNLDGLTRYTKKPPTAILNLKQEVNYGDMINIQGTASGEGFVEYKLYYGQGDNPKEWIEIITSNIPVTNGVLASNFDTSVLNEGYNALKLIIKNNEGLVSKDIAILYTTKYRYYELENDLYLDEIVPVVKNNKLFYITIEKCGNTGKTGLYMKDLSTNEKIKITDKIPTIYPYRRYPYYPRDFFPYNIYDDYVVWTETYDNLITGYNEYNCKSSAENEICNFTKPAGWVHAVLELSKPNIGYIPEHYKVYKDNEDYGGIFFNRTSNNDLFVYDINTNNRKGIIITGPFFSGLSGVFYLNGKLKFLVHGQVSVKLSKIYIYNINTKTTEIINGIESKNNLNFSREYVIWESASGDSYHYNIITKETKQGTIETSPEDFTISGNKKVSYSGYTSLLQDEIKLEDITTGSIEKISFDPLLADNIDVYSGYVYIHRSPKIEDSKIVWECIGTKSYPNCPGIRYIDWSTILSTDSNICFLNLNSQSIIEKPTKKVFAHYSFENRKDPASPVFVIDDITGNDNDILGENVIQSIGKQGQAVKIDSFADRLFSWDGTNFPIGSQVTISAWINPSSYIDSTYNGIVSYGPRTTRSSAVFAIKNNGNLVFSNWENEVYQDQGIGVAKKQWNHIAVSVEDKTVKFYINGELQDTKELAYPLTITQSVDFYLGTIDSPLTFYGSIHGVSNYPNRYFNGSIDEVKIWGYILSDEEIRDEYCRIEGCGQTTITPQTNLISSSSPSQVNIGEKFNITCNFGKVVGCINVDSEDSDCDYKRFDGTSAVFECTTNSAGVKENKCMLFVTSDSDPLCQITENKYFPIGSMEVVGKSLIAHYPFENNANDVLGNNVNGVVNGPTSVQGKIGQAYQFDGIDDSITIPDNNLLTTPNQFSWNAWVYVTKDSWPDGNGNFEGWATIFAKENHWEEEWFSISNNRKIVTYFDSGNFNGYSSGSIEFNKWQMVTVTWNGTDVKYYINGNYDSSLPYSGTIDNLPKNLIIGRTGGGIYNFKGKIDEVKIWNYALNDSEVRGEYCNLNGCLVSSSVPSQVNFGQTFQIGCDFGKGLPCISANHSIQGCLWANKWEGTMAFFNCTANTLGIQNNTCDLFDYFEDRNNDGINDYSECAKQVNQIDQTNVISSCVPSVEVCDGIDNDCNIGVDEGCECIQGQTKQCGSSDIGICRYGTQTCDINGVWSSCVGNVEPRIDNNCNNIDEDCDDVKDNGYIGVATNCGKGECAGNTGVIQCVNGIETNTCNAFEGAVSESCEDSTGYDGKDNNCDDFIDLNCDSYCDKDGDGYTNKFICAVLPRYQGGDCDDEDASRNPGMNELCNNRDDDCEEGNDGVDETWYGTESSCGVGGCASTGVYSCVNGNQVDSCVAGSPVVEVCNNVDDDCDGDVDENPSALCDNGLFCDGSETCSGGRCIAETPVPCSEDNILCTIAYCDENNNQCSFNTSNCGCSSGQDSECPDDRNICTDAICGSDLMCGLSYNILNCDDNDACTQNDACNSGICSGTQITCNDNEVCTVDRCIQGECKHIFNNSDPSCERPESGIKNNGTAAVNGIMKISLQRKDGNSWVDEDVLTEQINIPAGGSADLMSRWNNLNASPDFNGSYRLYISFEIGNNINNIIEDSWEINVGGTQGSLSTRGFFEGIVNFFKSLFGIGEKQEDKLKGELGSMRGGRDERTGLVMFIASEKDNYAVGEQIRLAVPSNQGTVNCRDEDNDGLLDFHSQRCSEGKDVCIYTNRTYFAHNPNRLDEFMPEGISRNRINRDSIFDFENLTLVSGNNKIIFKQKVKLIKINESGCFEKLNFSLESFIKINNTRVFVNTSYFSELNKSARIIFSNISFVAPVVYRDGVLCSLCNTNYTNGSLEIDVPGFSEYEIREGTQGPPASGPGSNSGSSGGSGSSSSSSSGGSISNRTPSQRNTSVVSGSLPISTSCTENWNCSEWNDCINGKETKTCIDSNNCGSENNKPGTEKDCEQPVKKNRIFFYSILISVIIIIILVIIYFLIKVHNKREFPEIVVNSANSYEKIRQSFGRP